MSQFGVDLHGVISLLSRHIYSGPHVYLRELLQNSRDAVIARGGGTPDPDWGVRIRPATATTPFILEDDGIGMSAAEIKDLLATVGRSSKRDMLDLPNRDYLGHFGIGLLSCFMVAQTIELVTRKAGERAAVWRGEATGTFTVEELSDAQTDALPFGTRVTLRPSPDTAELVQDRKVRELAREFAEFLPVPVHIVSATGQRDTASGPAPFLDHPADHKAVLDYGESLLGEKPLATIPLNIPGTATRGVGFVHSRARRIGRKEGARVYLGRMLLSAEEPEIVPDWAFFVQVVVSSDLLTPTASRESLVKDDAVAQTRDGVAKAIRTWIMGLAKRDPAVLHQFLNIHSSAIRAACVEDDELFAIVGRYLTFETPDGDRTLESILSEGKEVRYATSLDEYRMLAGLRAPGVLINAAYVYQEELLDKARVFFPEASIAPADVMGALGALDAPPQADTVRTTALATKATAALAQVDVDVVVKVMAQPDPPAFFVADASVLARADMTRASEIASGPWAAALRQAGARLDQVQAATGDVVNRAQVCLNWRSPLVRHLATVDDEQVLSRAVRMLYVQALLEGRRPLLNHDRALMNDSLNDLITLSLGFGSDQAPQF